MTTRSVQLLSHVRLFATSWTAAHQASLSITNSWSLLKVMSIELGCHPTTLSSFIPFHSCLQSFPASESFSMSRLFPYTGASALASVLSMSIQGWLPWRLTGLISLLSKGLSGVFSRPQFEGINSLVLCLLYSPALTTACDHWKDYSLYILIFVSTVMFWLFSTLPRFVIALPPRSKHLLIWLQSPSTVILEPKKRKSVTTSTFSPSIYHEVMGLMPRS